MQRPVNYRGSSNLLLASIFRVFHPRSSKNVTRLNFVVNGERQ